MSCVTKILWRDFCPVAIAQFVSDLVYLVATLLIWVMLYPITDQVTRTFVRDDLWTDALLAVISFDILLEAVFELRNSLRVSERWLQAIILSSLLVLVISMLGFRQSVQYWFSFLG